MISAESFLPHFRNCDRRVTAVRPEADEARKAAMTQAAQAVLDVRGQHPDCRLADLYDETSMPPSLRKAHQANDRAVLAAHGFFPRPAGGGDRGPSPQAPP